VVDVLTAARSALWEAYLRAEARVPRAERLSALAAFVATLAASPAADWHPWARSLAERVVDRGDDFVIRTPLFEWAVFPALLAGYRDGRPGCARWLAGLARHLDRCPGSAARLPPAERAELGLLRAAVRADPGDRASRRRLVGYLADRLRYALHGPPAGVLYGMDGADPDQCPELERVLDEFVSLAAAAGPGPDCSGLIRDCRLHSREYRGFLLSSGMYPGYRRRDRRPAPPAAAVARPTSSAVRSFTHDEASRLWTSPNGAVAAATLGAPVHIARPPRCSHRRRSEGRTAPRPGRPSDRYPSPAFTRPTVPVPSAARHPAPQLRVPCRGLSRGR
jgi:hypothetical protein